MDKKILDLRDFEVKEVHDDGEFEGHASVFGDADSYNDIVAPGAFKKTLREHKRLGRMPAMLWQHRTDKPLGIWLEIKEDDRGLFVRGKLLIEKVQAAREAHELLREKAISGLSIGYTASKFKVDNDTGQRTLTEINLWEISLVTFPALDSARVAAVKTVVPFGDLNLADRSRPWQRSRAEARVRAWAGADEAPNAKYRRAFVWYDREDAETFGAYKLQIADVVSNELVAVPRAVFAVAGVLMGARGGVDISEADQAGARRHVARYYAKMAEDFDDETIVPPWDKAANDDLVGAIRDVIAATADTIETTREFEDSLRDAGFSNGAAKAIAGCGFKEPDMPTPRDEDGDTELVDALTRATAVLTRLTTARDAA